MILLSKNICVGIRRKNSIQLCAGKYLPANLGFGERQESLGGVRRYRRRYEIVVLKSRITNSLLGQCNRICRQF